VCEAPCVVIQYRKAQVIRRFAQTRARIGAMGSASNFNVWSSGPTLNPKSSLDAFCGRTVLACFCIEDTVKTTTAGTQHERGQPVVRRSTISRLSLHLGSTS